jgi:hypothetical protein
MAARIKPAAPAPRIGVDRIARAERDRADPHVAEIDQPRFLTGIRAAAAGEGGHALLKRGERRPGKLDHRGCCYALRAEPGRPDKAEFPGN